MKNLQEKIKSKALELEFDAIGFCEADLPESVTKHLHEFIDKGRYGSMKLQNMENCLLLNLVV